MKNNTSSGKFIFVASYIDAPESAKYILRDTISEVIFEEYPNKLENSTILLTWEISGRAYKEEFENILLQCREVAGPDAIIYVEKPFWMVDPEFDDDNFVAENADTIDEDEIEKYQELKYLAGIYDDEDDN